MRRIVSILMMICFLGLVTTALTMLLSEKGGERQRVRLGQIPAGAAGVSPVEGPKQQKKFFPKEMHEMFGITFMIVGCFHIILNRKALFHYWGRK